MDLIGTLSDDLLGMAEWQASLRLLIAALLGGAIGFDRERHDKPAGLRTHMLISLAAAMFTIIALELHQELVREDAAAGADPIRIIEAVTAGVAFLAAGAIIRGRGTVHGITTGANMWLAGALGVACGAGYYVLAVLGTVLGVLILLLAVFEARLGGSSKPREAQDRE